MFALALAVLGAGFVGSLHCVGMCGPLVLAAQQGPHRDHHPGRAVVAYQLGRLIAYACVGALAGAVGLAVESVGHDLFGLQRVSTAVAGVAMMLVGVYGVLGFHRLLPPWLQGRAWLGVAVGRLFSPTLVQLGRQSGVRRGFTLGSMSALMPCGWLYSFAIVAAGTAAPHKGALVMVSFWLGTLPALLATAAVGSRAQRALGRYSRIVMAWILIGVGGFTLAVRAKINLAVANHECCDHHE